MRRAEFRKNTLIRVVAVTLGTYALFFSAPSLAADHVIPSSQSAFRGNTVQPGDRILLESGNRGPLTITGVSGTASNPVIIQNDTAGTGPTVIRRTSGTGMVFICRDCKHVVIDGSAKWRNAPSGETYGIKVTMTGGDVSHFLRMTGSSSNFKIRYVEVDGVWPRIADNGIGISVNDHQYNRTDNPGEWRQNILIENNFVHDVEGECIYIGPNFDFGGGEDDLLLRNIEIRENFIRDCGWDGIQLKSAVEGDNSIHHNRIVRAGKRRDTSAGQHHGISLYESTGAIHHNWVEKAGESGIQHFIHRLPTSFGVLGSRIYNNVIIDAGVTGPQPGKGITVGRQSNQDAIPSPTIYNNTIIRAEEQGINVGFSVSGSGTIRNNVVASSGGNAISAPDNIVVNNNRIGSVGSMRFVDAGSKNFRLASISPARDAATTSPSPADDFEGTLRPYGRAPDQGAFEYSDRTVSQTRPMPPVDLQAE